jgi:hypothetical protein
LMPDCRSHWTLGVAIPELEREVAYKSCNKTCRASG